MNGINLIAQGFNRLDQSASNLAHGIDKADLTKETVEQLTARHETKAGVNLIKTEDEMLGALLDIVG